MAITVVDHVGVGFADGSTANGSTGHDVSLPGAGSAQAGDFDVLFVGSDTTVTTPGGGTLFDLYSTFVGNQGGYAFVRRCGAATITKDATGSTAITTNATSATVDITAAKVGTIVYAWVALGINAGTVSATGWTSVANADEGTSAHYALLWRRKALGDTTFSFGWTTTTKGVIAWTSYFGVDPTTPHENATLVTNGVTSRTAVPTSSQTPSAATRTALACFAVRTTNSANKPITWTPDAALVERIDVDNNAAAATPWMGVEMADSNGPVTAAAHSYTGTHNVAESHDASMILFLIPAAAEGPTVRIKTNGDFDTVALFTRVRGADSPDVAVNAHLDNSGNTASPALSTGTLAATGEAIFVGSTNTDMQAGTPTGPTWGGTYTALDTATSGSGASGTWGASAWNTPVGTAAESPSVSWTNGMRNRYIFAVTFTAAAGGSSPVTINDTSSSASGATSTETLQIGVTINDGSSSASGGTTADSLAIGVTKQDTSSSASGATSADSLAIGVTLQDGSSSASGGSSAETLLIGTVIQDGSGGASGASSTETLSVGTVANVTINDFSGGASGGESKQTVQSGGLVVHDKMVMPVLLVAQACMQTEVGKVASPPASYQIRPGATFVGYADQTHDECCEGIAWVRPGPMWETDDFPAQRNQSSNTDPADYAVTIELGVLRCLPTVSDQPQVDGIDAKPTAAQWLAATQAAMDDAAALRRVVCCLRELYHIDAVTVGQLVPLENEANCAGTSLTITMRVPACDCFDAG
jgi:hypothetical protein